MRDRLPEWGFSASPTFKAARRELAGVREPKKPRNRGFDSTAPAQPTLRTPDETTFANTVRQLEELTGVKPTAEQLEHVTRPRAKP